MEDRIVRRGLPDLKVNDSADRDVTWGDQAVGWESATAMAGPIATLSR